MLSRFEASEVSISSWNRTDTYRHGVDIFLLLDAVVVSMARGPCGHPARASVRRMDHGGRAKTGGYLGPDWSR